VNVTLIFSLVRYQEVMEAFLAGLEQARANGHDLSAIGSVASFFVSRVDTEVDKRLEKIGSEEAKKLKGKAAIANARLAYQKYEQVFSSPRWQALADAGAHPQRPLWASTSTKNPAFRDTIYVEELVAPGVVNTMPEPTIHAFADHGEVRGDTITGGYAEAQQLIDELNALGVSYDDVVLTLEREGVDKFSASWQELLDGVKASLAAAEAGAAHPGQAASGAASAAQEAARQ
jgi:transaldolase